MQTANLASSHRNLLRKQLTLQTRLSPKSNKQTYTLVAAPYLQSQHARRFSLGCYCATGCVMIGTLGTQLFRTKLVVCEQKMAVVDEVGIKEASSNLLQSSKPITPLAIYQGARRGWKIITRLLVLAFIASPAIILYPFFSLLPQPEEDLEQCKQDKVLSRHVDQTNMFGLSRLRRLYFEICLFCAEKSGAAVVKLLQWAGSRPDVFGLEFCSVFSRLQDHTTPHGIKHTEKCMKEAYGDDWGSAIELHEVVGSGCIGQVYRGRLLVDSEQQKPLLASAIKPQVAVKVLHPRVQDAIEADLEVMRAVASVLTFLDGDAVWMDWHRLVDEFSRLLLCQVDLRNETKNLQRFADNFKGWEDTVIFPKLIPGFPTKTKNVLVETFLDGVPVLEYARRNYENKQHLSEMCKIAIRAVCKMIFLDNYTHGDLHPGNVLVGGADPKFILLDFGIVAEHSENDHQAIVDIIASFIKKDGRRAGQLMMVEGTRGKTSPVDAERFVDRIAAMVATATSDKMNFMENLGPYISIICEAASEHRVHMLPAFISAALAVKVQEGIAVALDPSVSVIKVATPMVVEMESRRQFSKVVGKLWQRGTSKE